MYRQFRIVLRETCISEATAVACRMSSARRVNDRTHKTRLSVSAVIMLVCKQGMYRMAETALQHQQTFMLYLGLQCPA